MRNEVSVALVLAGLPAPGWGQYPSDEDPAQRRD